MRNVHRWLLLPVLVVVLAITSISAGRPSESTGTARAIEVANSHAQDILNNVGITGIGAGLGTDGRAVVVILTESAGITGLPSELDGVKVVVRVSGKFVALNPPPHNHGGGDKDKVEVDPTARFDRPVPIGVSTGHPSITAGTIGARVTKGGSVYALSNNHVYAASNAASIGDAVIQPGTFDGGAAPGDTIGTLAEYKEILFDGSDNTIDAAIALSSTANLGNSTPSDGYGTPQSATVAASINQKVKKYGRTTGETKGSVQGIGFTINVDYGAAGVATFVNQIVIGPGSFSAGGDSGSLIVDDSKGKGKGDNGKPVGLLFAGSFFFTIANPIDPVLDEFGVTIDGQ